jgi:hypothetical protein
MSNWEFPLIFNRRFWALLLVPLALARAGDWIRLSQPVRFVVAGESVVLQGRVETPGVTELTAEARALVSPGEAEVFRARLPVAGTLFQGSLRLHPGLNLVHVHSRGGRLSADFAFYRAGARSASPRPWGRRTAITLAQTMPTRVAEASVRVDGVVRDAAVASVRIIALGPGHFGAFQSEGAAGDADRLPVQRAAVERGRFQATVSLQPGHNILILRPDSPSVDYESIAVRPVLYDRASPRLSLEVFALGSGRWEIRGRTSHREVRFALTGLAEEGTPASLVPRTFWERTLTVVDGEFRTELNAADLPAGRRLKGLPTVFVRAGRDESCYTLSDWTEPP